MHNAWIGCGHCGRGVDLMRPLVQENLYDHHDAENTRRLAVHLVSHYAAMIVAEREHHSAIDAWANEGGA
jgi:hypothetical protein